MERPGIQALISAVEAGEANVVVTYKLDRVSRSLPDFYAFWQRLERRGVEFVSATQNFDTSTPMGRLMLNVLLSFGQFERELTAERTAHKLGERAKHGRWNGGWCPLGYEYDTRRNTLPWSARTSAKAPTPSFTPLQDAPALRCTSETNTCTY